MKFPVWKLRIRFRLSLSLSHSLTRTLNLFYFYLINYINIFFPHLFRKFLYFSRKCISVCPTLIININNVNSTTDVCFCWVTAVVWTRINRCNDQNRKGCFSVEEKKYIKILLHVYIGVQVMNTPRNDLKYYSA